MQNKKAKSAAATPKANPLWGGHFEAGPDALMQAINASIGFDKKLYRQDIEGSRAHATMLAKAGILTKEEKELILLGLDKILHEIETGHFTFTPALEDIHMHVESRLKEIIGDAAGKLHTARSRNDQVATDFRLYVRDAIDATDKALKKLQSELIKKAEKEWDTILPGFTHLQCAQPITFGHHLLAYVEMIGRDRSRLTDARKRLNESPLGSAALAGTSYPIDREATASALGFDHPMRNSLDGVSDRDFAIEFLSAASLIAVHLSRLAEEIVVWMSGPFGFVTISESFTSGSSIMPQKRNPDAAELVRAKTGRVFGSLTNLLTVMKGLPLAYSKDMQEDKEPVFDTVATLEVIIPAMTGMIHEMKVNRANMRKAAELPFITATDLADWLAQTFKIPFRQCHHITGKLVKLAESKKCDLKDLSLKDMQSVEKRITKDVFSVLTLEYSVASRKSFGGTAPSNVKKMIEKAKKLYL